MEERLMAEIAASEARLWAAIEERARPQPVRVFRGSGPPAVYEGFAGGSPILLDLPQDPEPAATPGRPPLADATPATRDR